MNIEKILHFLKELKINNNRDWFAENKAWYDELKSDFEKISKELILEIAKFDEDIKHVEVKDCVFRIYRDTRFSNDKTPYKTHFGVFIASAGGRKSQRGGYYLHLDPDGCFVGMGVWCPEPNLLKALRQSVYDNIDELNEIRNTPEFSQYFTTFFEEDKLKTVPRGFPKDFPDAELLKLKHYLVEYKLNESHLKATDFVGTIAQIMKCAYPLNRFLNYTVDEVSGKK
jgi:TIGR02453 family protein